MWVYLGEERQVLDVMCDFVVGLSFRPQQKICAQDWWHDHVRCDAHDLSGFEGAGEQVILHLIIADATPRTINGVFPALERHFPIDHFESELVPPTDANRDTETLTGKSR